MKPNNKRTCPIWTVSREKLLELSLTCTSFGQVLKEIGVRSRGSYSKDIRLRMLDEGIDVQPLIEKRYKTSHFLCREVYRKKRLPLLELFSKPGFKLSHPIKNRIREEGLLGFCCILCGQNNVHNGQPLVLQIDHINGVHDDDRLENLRLLCPNCHTQTATFGARRFKRQRRPVRGFDVLSIRKAVRPTPEDLTDMLWTKPTEEIAKQYGVSDKAIDKWAKKYGIPKPPRGYWTILNYKGKPNVESRKVEWPTKERLNDLLQKVPTTVIGKVYGVAKETVAGWAHKYNLELHPKNYWKQKDRRDSAKQYAAQLLADTNEPINEELRKA